MKKNITLMILIVLFIFGLNLILSYIQDAILQEITFQSIMFIAAAYLFHMGLNLGMLQICLSMIKNQEVNFSQLFGSFHMLMSYVLATALYLAALIIAASPGIYLLLTTLISENGDRYSTDINGKRILFSAMLIIIPATYLSVRLQFYDYFLVDEECGILEAIKKSADISKGYVLELFVLGAILSLIILVSIIPLGAGLIISIPLATLTTSLIYFKLKANN